MVDTLGSRNERSLYPSYITELFRGLLKQGDPATSSLPFVRALHAVMQEGHVADFPDYVARHIIWSRRNAGIGYITSGEGHDRQQELLATAYIAKCFQDRPLKTRPIIVPIDEFYRFVPGNSSLVAKTRIFSEIAEEQSPGENYALLLSGFSDSQIFTSEILAQVPIQHNAGLDIQTRTQFGSDLLHFACHQLRSIIEQSKGDMHVVLHNLIGTKDGQEDNARLLLATGLLLQDIQSWQKLWFEGETRGVSLYIVAPSSFHDAMNRLNFCWGHGGCDYEYRASSSLGSHDRISLAQDVQDEGMTNFYDQGLSADEFERRIKPFLEK